MHQQSSALTVGSALEYVDFFLEREQPTQAMCYLLAAETLHGTQPSEITHRIQSRKQQLVAHYATLAETFKNAQKQALAVREYSYAPYSTFHVGASIIDNAGKVWRGVNVECSSYGLTICAERSALVSMVTAGTREFACVIVTADTQNLTPPCGACRQMLYDFAPHALVVLLNTQNKREFYSMNALLPAGFHPGFLHQ